MPDMRQLTITSMPIDTYSYLTYSEMTTIENAIAYSIFQNGTLSWDSINELRRSSAFFWRLTHMYLALPKAIFIVYVFRTMLQILDRSKKEILEHANHDELTTLKNRRYGLTQMQKTLIASKDGQDYSVILLDLDLFKDVNDNYGHAVGDQVLREVADVLNIFTDKDTVSRYGGEEFLIVLPETTHNLAMNMAEKLRLKIAQHVIQVDDAFSFQVTASFGVYTLTDAELKRIKQKYLSVTPKMVAPKLTGLQMIKSGRTKPATTQNSKTAQLPSDICQRLISTADKALYEAKDRGRNQVVSANDLLAEGSINEPRYSIQ